MKDHHPPEQKPDFRARFSAEGFQVLEGGSDSGGCGVKKYNCLRYFKRGAEGNWEPAGPPYFVVRGLNCELEDRGYQKFWYGEGKRFPIRQADLKALHQFDEEVRAILGLKSLYHESLGTTCARSVYDRLTGRSDR